MAGGVRMNPESVKPLMPEGSADTTPSDAETSVVSAAKNIKHFRAANGRLLTMETLCDTTVSPLSAAKDAAARGTSEGYAVFMPLILPKKESDGLRVASNETEADAFHLCLLLRPVIAAQKAILLTALAAVAALRSIQKYTRAQLDIHWVNDIYAGSKHVCAIQTEGALNSSAHFNYVIADFYVKLPRRLFNRTLSDLIYQVFSERNESLSAQIAADMMTEFFALYEEIARPSSFLPEYRKYVLLGRKHIRILQNGKARRGRIIGIDDNAHLLVQIGASVKTVYSSGELAARKHSSG